MAQRATGTIMTHSSPSIYPASTAAPRCETDGWPAWLDVDLGAIRRNAERMHAAARVPIVAMVKADGYGSGAVAVARTLVRMGERLWGFGVATLLEADALRAAGIDARILCCTPLLPGELHAARRLDVRPALHRTEDILAWGATGAAWHLSIDTGMSRAGVRWDEVVSLMPALRRHPPEGVFTHFHSAEMEDGTQEVQEMRFERALAGVREALPGSVLVHCDNSAGIASRARADRGSPGALARPGIGLYGAVVTEFLALEQTVHLRARVIDIRVVHDGDTVSYGGTWRAVATRRIATVAIGHGDGYRRALSDRGVALLHGTRVPVIGIVTMDMTMIDVTDVSCEIGHVVTLIGRDGPECLTTDAVAASGALSPYELLVGLRLRVPRRYSASPEDAGAGA